jgi:hypothetical protein
LFKIAEAFLHFVDALYGVFYLAIQKTLAGFVKEGVKRKIGNWRGGFSGHRVTIGIHALSLLIDYAFNSGLPGYIV